MSNAGIDYGMGRSNVNRETGIHYGVISQNSVNLDVLSDVQMEGADYGKPTCPECGAEIGHSSDVEPDAEWNDGKDYACATCKECYWSDSVFSEEMLGWSHESDGYKLTDCLDTDVFVLESPYFTHAQFCSPCVPGAGNLDNPCEDGPKTYCLGPEWFDEHSPMPYRCYRVSDGTEVTEA
jgi:hypothetical protein